MKKEELAISFTKSLLGAVPYIGSGLNEVIFEYRSRVKQERINRFVNELSNFFESINPQDIDLENIKKDEFGDIFESILKRVSLNKSNEKLKRFKKILINEILNPSKNDFAENYLDLIEKINEIQIKILFCHRKLITGDYQYYIEKQDTLIRKNKKLKVELSENKGFKNKGYASNVTKLERLINNTIKDLEKVENIINNFNKYKTSEFYNISHGDYIYYVQDLVAKSLLIDLGVGGIGTKPYEQLSLTEFGNRFLAYIEK